MYPFFITEYARVMFPDPTVAAIKENIEPAIPPARNVCYICEYIF
jgi:hypothetical protein